MNADRPVGLVFIKKLNKIFMIDLKMLKQGLAELIGEKKLPLRKVQDAVRSLWLPRTKRELHGKGPSNKVSY